MNAEQLYKAVKELRDATKAHGKHAAPETIRRKRKAEENVDALLRQYEKEQPTTTPPPTMF